MTLTIPGLAPLEGGWRAFAALSEAEQLQRLVPWLERLRAMPAADRQRLAALARLPLGETVASPFGLRAIALAVRVGATSVDRETRTLVDWAVAGAVEDESHGVWEHGRLHVGKYQAFLQDAPFATYDPAHIAKWGPHELMHRAAGFFWRPGASRFELYLGARLNELLPVALWYGPDQLLRLRDGAAGFVRVDAAREASLADTRWLDGSLDETDLRPTLRWLREGFAYVAAELATIDRERRSGRTLATPWTKGGARLDASSDAAAYVVAHAERLADPAVVAALEETAPADACFATVEAYREHVESVWEALFFGDIELDEEAIASARAVRVRWDHALRAALADNGADELADGLEAFDLGQLHEGVLSVAPATAELAEERDPEWLERFAFGEAIRARAPLGERLRRFWLESDTEMADLVRFEHLLATVSPGTRNHLSDPREASTELLARSDGFAMHRFDHDVAALHAGAEASGEPIALLIGRVTEEVAVIPLDPAAATLWARLEDEAVPEASCRQSLGDEWIDALLDAGALVPSPGPLG